MRTICVLFLLFSLQLAAQERSPDALYRKYAHVDGVSSFMIPGIVMKFAALIAPLDQEEKTLLRSIHAVRILEVRDDDLNRKLNFYEECSNPGDRFEELLNIRDGKENVRIYVCEKQGVIREMVIVVGGDENVLVSIKGKILPEYLSQLASSAGGKREFIF